jgi:NADH-quinone oxidoreductase subunit E
LPTSEKLRTPGKKEKEQPIHASSIGGAEVTPSVQVIDNILTDNNFDRANLVTILQQVQAAFNYLPEPALHQVARRLDMPVAHVYGMATFYKAFSLVPRGKHQIQVCEGTACHVRGAPLLLRQLERELGIEVGATTPDLEFSLDSVRCVGCCSLAPVVRIDGDTYGKLTQKQVGRILKRIRKHNGEGAK